MHSMIDNLQRDGGRLERDISLLQDVNERCSRLERCLMPAAKLSILQPFRDNLFSDEKTLILSTSSPK
jgi:hypothetical protein